MAENSKIEWTHHTFNPWRGCQKVSPGCENCYAETMSRRNPAVLGEWGPAGRRVVAAESYWRQPLKWDRQAAAAGERRRVFCASLADVFEDRPELVAPRVRLFHLVSETRHLDWLLLTKRPENIKRFHGGNGVPRSWPENMPPNVWLGVSVERQQEADGRIPHLLRTPAAVRFLSCEPLLSAVDVSRYLYPWSNGARVDWLICGGESGPGARPMHPDWARSLRDQCHAAGVPFFFKQWGEYAVVGRPVDADEVVRMGARSDLWVNRQGGRTHTDWDTVALKRVGKKAAGRLLDGRDWNEFPEAAP